MAKKSTLERFSEFVGTPFFAASYLVSSCIQAVKIGWMKAKVETLPTTTTNDNDDKK